MQLSPSQQIRRQLRQRILDGQFEPGGTLPTIRSLAKSFNVSTKTVQKAIHALSQEGIIEAKRGTGLFIKTQAGGGWGYHPNKGAGTANMTTAGLCNLVITGMDLAEGKAALRKDGSADNCGEYKENEPIARALTWLGEVFPSRLDDQSAGATFLRVELTLVLAALWTIPVGVFIGLRPKFSALAQPLAQIAASVPAPALFPIVLLILIRIGGGLGPHQGGGGSRRPSRLCEGRPWRRGRWWIA